MNKKCYIITAYIDGLESNKCVAFFESLKEDMKTAFVICADGGYNIVKKFGIVPNMIVGDFDSYRGDLPDDVERNMKGIELYRVSSIKDDTDTGLCIKIATARGYRDITIIGGIGGRLSHTVANLQLLADTSTKVDKVVMMDSFRFIQTICGPKRINFKRCNIGIADEGKCFISVFSHSDNAKGVSIDGTFYTLENMGLSNLFPLGVSNEFINESIDISVEEGILHIIIDV